MIKILLVDDQPMFRQGLASLLRLETDFEIVGEASDGQESRELSAQLQPDVILMDMRMPVCNGVEATRQIHQQFPWIRILVLTTFDEDDYVFQSLEMGALGYLLKSTPAKQVAIAIRNVHHGYSQLGPTIATKVFSQVRAAIATPKATPEKDTIRLFNARELEILKLLGKGCSNREIAAALHLTEGTIKNHLTNIFSLLEARDRTQAALWAHEHLLP